MARTPKLSPHYDARRGRWVLSIAPRYSSTGLQRQETFRTEAEAKARALELRGAVDHTGRVPKGASPELIRAAIYYDQAFRFLGFSGLEEACRRFEAQETERQRSPTLRAILEPYLAEYPKASTARDWRWIEGKLSPGLFDRRVATMDSTFWRDELAAAARRHGWSARTHNRALMWLKSLFRHALTNGRVTRDPVEAIRSREVQGRAIEVLEPEVVEELLVGGLKTDPGMAFTLAVLCFAGLRPESELLKPQGIRWEDVFWSQGLLRVTNHKTGKAAGAHHTRYVRINPTLLSWLSAFRQESGRMCPYTYMQARDRRTALSLRPDGSRIVDWSSRDLTRHSFGSYLAAVATADEVREAMGHTDFRTFARHYRNARTPEQAARYWSLTFDRICEIACISP